MVSKKSSFIIAAIVSIFSLVIVAYTSCKKNDKGPNVCEGVVCQNNGYCRVDTLLGRHPVCICPTGYEGPFCDTASVSKFIGGWDVTQIVAGSDSANFKGVTYHYTAFLEQSATPTTFFIDNVSNDRFYNDIICTLDSDNSKHFYIDTISAYHMVYDHYQILWGGGVITDRKDSIYATFSTRHLSPTTNWLVDTFTLIMVPHHF